MSEDEGFDLKDLRSNYGAGIRFKSRRKVHFRVDAVRGSEGMRWHVKLGRSF